MSTEKTDAIVIRQADWSETSRVVTFFTHDHGKIAALAKGAKRLKGPFEAAIDLLVACRIVFIRKSSSSLDILTEAQLIERFQPNAANLLGLYGGYYIAELLDGLTEPYDPHPTLYKEAAFLLNRLSTESDSRLTVLRFELTTLREIGQLPSFEQCIACGRTSLTEQQFAFWVSQGGLLCPSCRRPEYQSNRIQAGTVAILRQLVSGNTVWERLTLSPQQFKEIRQVTTSAISAALGRRPKTLRYLKF
ncbi:MAG: DNA repair protein RecO [Planctomycetaceae bacterium]|nr:DNA repair protein RecO [Planctomycetaceae bacterium]